MRPKGHLINGAWRVARVDAAHEAAVEQRTVQVEIPTVDKPGVFLAGAPDGVGCKRMAAAVPAGKCRAMAGPEKNCFGRSAFRQMPRETEKTGCGVHQSSLQNGPDLAL
ncbi:hypothetical protein CHH27_12960 [Labrenzia sp. VG12]|nr:hypothetical protein CHH27_12960 [Labrenzia sp. VG12]